ncbi:MAG TPA: helix-turn-helix domain-containing protein [Pseudonocardiaceae bacterium]|nr:helix-turn-helix domain-containing protein [Pseudonocardiaceae bacterium]
MPLPKDYAGQQCSLARTLEIIGERWTMLIVRDAFFGVRRFGDFAEHLGIPRAVLSERLASLAEAGVLSRISGAHGHIEYALTGKGLSLWPALRSLVDWGDEYYSAAGPRRVFRHAADDGTVPASGICGRCGATVPVPELVVAPGPGLAGQPAGRDPVTMAMAAPRRLLEPIRG